VTLFDFETEHDPGGKVRTSLPAGMTGDAEFYGEDDQYRLWLLRNWSGGIDTPIVLWIGMNPSTADARVNDPTISRIIEFSRSFGYRACVICNVMDYRATHPADLCRESVVPSSDKNVETIVRLAKVAREVILCHGLVPKALQKYAAAAVAALRSHRINLHCMGRTATGSPRHPLYLRSDTQPEPFL
jgi:hypothetical protein